MTLTRRTRLSSIKSLVKKYAEGVKTDIISNCKGNRLPLFVFTCDIEGADLICRTNYSFVMNSHLRNRADIDDVVISDMNDLHDKVSKLVQDETSKMIIKWRELINDKD